MWKTRDEWKKAVEPKFARGGTSEHASALERAYMVGRYAAELEAAIEEAEKQWPAREEFDRKAEGALCDVFHRIELICWFAQPMAGTKQFSDVFHARDSFEAYYKDKPYRLHHDEIIGAVRAFHDLVNGDYVERTGSFVLELASDLPADLSMHFIQAREAFSVELDDLGAFAAVRGLEATVRRILRGQPVSIAQRRKAPEPLADADLYEIIEALPRLKWADANEPFLPKQGALLLHVLREARNATAHTGEHGLGSEEIARLAAKHAATLWAASQKGERELVTAAV